MALFDSIVDLAKQRSGFSDDQAGGIVAAVLRFLADPARGGFGGFIDRFRSAGLGSLVDSWISRGDNAPISDEQVESVFGADGVSAIAHDSGIERGAAVSAVAGILPALVDTLTPDGQIPDQNSLMSRIGGFVPGLGSAVGGAAGAAASAGRGAAEGVGDSARAARDRIGGTADAVASNGGSVLRWLIPLLLLGLVVLLGYMFCGRGTSTTTVNVNTNRSSANLNANVNRTANANANAASNANTNTVAGGETARTLTEVSLPNGTKLQAYPGGIEDQLVRFIGSAEYKNASNDQLKDKWFNFDDLNFVFGKTELTPESKRQLDNIVAILKAFPDAKIKVGGYTDKKGDDAANLKLSDSRAKAVQAALQKAGVGAQVPEAEGYGEQFAKVDENASDEQRMVDRKTAVRLIK